MWIIDELKKVNLIEHITRRLWQKWEEKQWKVFFKAHEKDNTSSLCVWVDNSKWYKDFSETLWAWTIIDFEINFSKVELKDSIKILTNMYWIKEEKKEFKKSPKRYELAENFEKFRINWENQWFIRFLQTRGVTYDFIQKNKDLINKISKQYWYCENAWISWLWKNAIYKDVIIFPCFDWDEEKTLVWAKIRRVDWENFIYKWWSLKSVSIWKPKDYKWIFPFSTWINYNKISDDYVIITEWETDEIILKILWFESVIWNYWWVSACSEKIQSKVKKVKKVISFYDNDPAGAKANMELVEKIWRPIRRIVYPKIEGKTKFDVNDLFKMWYMKKDFDNLLENSEILDLETAKKELKELKNKNKKEEVKLYKNRIMYNDTKMEYFDIKDFNFKWAYTLARHLFIKPKELEELRQSKIIPTFEWICYFDWWKPNFFNLLNKNTMIKPSQTPEVHPEIKDLIMNLCNNNKDNAIWLMKAIIYKFTHLNDVFIPAVVFHWVWWTGKGLFIKLLEQIFWENNTQAWLWQEHLDSRFSAYSWQKLIVEFNELYVWNTAKWKKNMQKLKTLIMADKIVIEKKWQDAVWIDNIAWFIMSSNDSKPIQLDSVDSWNRRFTIIKTWPRISRDKWSKIAEIIKDKKNIENFIAWLFWKYKNIEKEKNISPLDNEDKRDLELVCETIWNLFFKRFEEEYPNINKITNHERECLVDTYALKFGDDRFRDERYNIKYFNAWLSHRYKIINTTIRGEKTRGYKIDKKVDWSWMFEARQFENLDNDFKKL